MPELPEVETTRRGIEPYLKGEIVKKVTLQQRALRWPVPRNLNGILKDQKFISVDRRGKYLLLAMQEGEVLTGTLLIHLGMSGHLSMLPAGTLAEKHDHVDIVLKNGQMLRYTDPRRFGAVLWLKGCNPYEHKLLTHLGPEPLESSFDASYLFERSRGRKLAIKTFIMDGKVVVGVGNIYANEALFLAGIRPTRQASSVTQKECSVLVLQIKRVLAKAIEAGGTTLRDFVSAEGKPGYFSQSLNVYGRGGEPCLKCRAAKLKEIRLGQRATVFCPRCQK